MQKIKFSVIMPAYNAEKYLQAAVDSVVDQTYSNWELIIVDDGSVDRTALLADQYAQQDNRILVVHQENSGTAAAARNSALEVVSGDYVQILDSDDLLSPELLENYEKILSANSIDILVPDAVCFNEENPMIWEKHAPKGNYDLILDGETAFVMSLTWQVHGWFCVKTDLVQRVKYNPELLNGDEFTTRRLYYAAESVSFSQGQYRFRRNKESTTQSPRNQVRLYECLLTDYNIYLYSLENPMQQDTRLRCTRKLTSSLIAHTMKFLTNREAYGESGNYASDILEKTYYNIRVSVWKKAEKKHLPLYFFSFGSYSRFLRIVKIYAGIKRLLKG